MSRILLIAILMAATGPALAQPDAEYAIRWSPKEGGPADLDSASGLLRVDGKASNYTIGYYEITGFAGGPAGFAPILRERLKGDKADTTWKYRGAATFPPGASDAWTCPLNKESKRKDEVDVSLLSDASVKRSFSRSCTAGVELKKALPAGLTASRKGCSSAMRRRESKDGDVTIEEWRMSNGDVLLEVSAKGRDDSQALAAFRDRFVKPLIATGIHPQDRSKTEIGTQCSASF
ncbi:MAG: hypothetical protein ABI277_19060 [Burkholderiaceae bacterium]